MINPKKLPEVFGKKHQKTRLETILRDCFNCGRETVYIYLGNFGTKYNPKHTYKCSCGIYYTSSKKLKGDKK